MREATVNKLKNNGIVIDDTIIDGTQEYVILIVDGSPKKFIINDVAKYYRTETLNNLSGARYFAGLLGDWRYIDHIAEFCLEYFKAVNLTGLRKTCVLYGIDPRF